MKSFSMTYAASLFSLAEEENLEEKIYGELCSLSDVFKENPDYSRLLDSPTIPSAQRIALVDEAFAQTEEYVLNFIKILCEKKSVHLFPECVKAYEKLYNHKLGIEKVTAITAVPLNDSLKEKLVSKLEKEYGKKIKLENKIDKSILGGIILRTDNSQTDASLRTRLDQVKAQISL